MGSLNEYVDANVATLHLLMHQKRKLHMMIEERKIALQATLNEMQNYQAQLRLMEQDA
jgi:hypothetical protein